MRRIASALALLGAAHLGAPAASAQAARGGVREGDALAVRDGARWVRGWGAPQAHARWAAASPALVRAVRWRRAAAGIETATVRVSAGSGITIRVALARLAPARLRLGLVQATRDAGLGGAWTVDSLPPDAVAAVNAGQFDGGAPWGWLVAAGVERQPPGTGSLAMALVVDTAGVARLVSPDELPAWRRSARLAFQSYPALLVGDGELPHALREPGRGVDLAHRDTRVALGELRDGRLLIALTRYDALDGALSLLPVGPTIPELAALMGALGCRRAVALDGGLSGQLAVRDEAGRPWRWAGMRRVPLALVAWPREERARPLARTAAPARSAAGARR